MTRTEFAIETDRIIAGAKLPKAVEENLRRVLDFFWVYLDTSAVDRIGYFGVHSHAYTVTLFADASPRKKPRVLLIEVSTDMAQLRYIQDNPERGRPNSVATPIGIKQGYWMRPMWLEAFEFLQAFERAYVRPKPTIPRRAESK